MLNANIDQTFLHMCAKPKQLQYLPHIVSTYGSATNMPLKWHIYATYAN